MIRLVLVDFDGTLCATHEAIGHCLVETLRAFGLPEPTGGEIMATIRSGVGLAETFALLVGDERLDTESLVLRYRALYNGGVADARAHLFPGAREALEQVRKLGVSIAVLSNKGELAVRRALQRYALLPLTDLVVCETPGVAKKPDPASYAKLVRPAFPEIAPRETMVLGDTVADLRYAANIGAYACWARYGYGVEEACRGLGPAATIDAIGELPDLLRGWEAAGAPRQMVRA